MKVSSVIPVQAGIQAVFFGFRLKLVPAGFKLGTCRNDDARPGKTFMLRCDRLVMAVRRYDGNL